jgi:Fe-S-cluster containining protein
MISPVTDKSISCGGHCCKDFLLPIGPEELIVDRARVLAGAESRWQDGKLIHEMLIWLGEYPEQPSTLLNPIKENRQHYTCKFHGADGRCTIYERRPHFCRSYPDDNRCRYHACSRNSWVQRWKVTRPIYVAAYGLAMRVSDWWRRTRYWKVARALRKIKEPDICKKVVDP